VVIISAVNIELLAPSFTTIADVATEQATAFSVAAATI